MPAPDNAIPWPVGLVFLSLFLFVATANWMIVWAAIFRKKHSSWVPLVGGLFGSAAFWLLPIARLHSYRSLPLLPDYGSLPGLLSCLVFDLSISTCGAPRVPLT